MAPTRPPALTFESVLEQCGLGALEAERVTTLQLNLGKLCNQACRHCHVEAGPSRTEIMSRPVLHRALYLLERSPEIDTVDITGGAPEMNPGFKELVLTARKLGKTVIDRCNLTILLEDGYVGTAELLAENQVVVTASLPCYTSENVDRQRGRHVFEKSIEAIGLLNALGYGMPGTGLELNLVYNPGGAFLPPSQGSLEAKYKDELVRNFGVRFNRLLTLTNLPINRFRDHLHRRGELDHYMELLVSSFNPDTVAGLMCRSLVSVSWNGRIYDCDFNQMLDLPLLEGARSSAQTIWDVESLTELDGRRIACESHCFGCTAGAGSSCGGALAA